MRGLKPDITKMGREKDVRGLTKALKHEDASVRGHAAIVLGDLGDKTSIPALKQALKDKDRLVRAHAKNSLQKIESQNVNTINDSSSWWSKQGTGTQLFLIVGGLFGIFLILGLAEFGIAMHSNSDLVMNGSAMAAAKNIIIQNTTGGYGDEEYRIKGSVLNNNSFDVDYVELNITGYAKNGTIVANDFTFVYVNSDTKMPAKTQGAFEKVLNDSNKQIVRYNITIKYLRVLGSSTNTYVASNSLEQEDKAISIVKNYGNGWTTIEQALESTANESEASGNDVTGGTWTATTIDSSNYKVVYSVDENGITQEAVFKVNIENHKVTGLNELGKDTVSVANT